MHWNMDSPPLKILNFLFTSLELIATLPHSPKKAMYFNHIKLMELYTYTHTYIYLY